MNRVEAPETSREGAERKLGRAFSELLNNLGSDPDSLQKFVRGVNDWLLTHPKYKGPVSALEPHDISGEPPIIIINPALP